jgi:hypothetical protein
MSDSAPTLPLLSLFAIVAQTPAVIFDGVVHYLGAAVKRRPAGALLYFRFEDTCFPLLPGQPLAEIEQQYLEIFAATAVEQYKTYYLQQVIDERLQTLTRMKTLMAQQNVQAFLVKQLIPRFKRLEGCQTVDTHHKQEAVISMMNVAADDALATPIAYTSLVTAIGALALILDGRVYPLVPVNARRHHDLVLRTKDRKCFSLAVPGRLIHEVETIFKTSLRQILQAQALAEAPERQERWQAVIEAEAELSEFLQDAPPMDSDYLYQGKLYNIRRWNGTWMATMQVPAYAIEVQGQLHYFPPTEVGLPISSCDPESVFVPGRARVLTAYRHMFVREGYAGDSICMVKGESYFQGLRRLPLDEAICAYLHDARYTLMAGYHAGNGSSPYHQIDALHCQLLSRQEANAKGIPVFPYNR